VVSSLLSKEQSGQFAKKIREEYDKLREGFLKKRGEKPLATIEESRKKAFVIDWGSEPPVPAKRPGEIIEWHPSVNDLKPYIDWTPFFQAWELHGRYPGILEDELVGEEAGKLYADAIQMLDRLESDPRIEMRGVCGVFPARREGDDIVLQHEEQTYRVFTLRQQQQKADNAHNHALADFIAPENDHLGSFAVHVFGADKVATDYEASKDDYNAILVKVLCDRLAEAFAEYLHERVRRDIWGYETEPPFDNADLIREKYRGIRPAPGYPACPDHLDKRTIWQLLDVEKRLGATLTESLAMYPASSVCGWYFAHPQAKYFGVGRIGKDQAVDYANRRNMPLKEIERWLSPILNY
jgi:5-methyltetrahydrofolate--homocysteine methyltransferase